jgi:predicted phage terminase large subunit-like protein
MTLTNQQLRDRYDPAKSPPGMALFNFTKEILGYDLLRDDPHYDICKFIAEGRGNGSWRTSNIVNIPLKSRPAKPPPKKFRALFVPRNSFKTTIGVISYVIWRLAYDKSLRINLTGYNTDRVAKNMTEIRWHFECNEKLAALYGNMYGKPHGGKWTEYDLQLYDPDAGALVKYQNVGNFSCGGLKSGATGAHYDIAIVDDSVCWLNISNAEQLEGPTQHVRMLSPMIDPGGELDIIGTRYDFQDAYQKMIDNLGFDVYLRSARNEDGSLWFPERLSEEYLESERLFMGDYLFSCQYLNEPISAEDQKFKEKWIELCTVKPGTAPGGECDTREYVDPAATDHNKSDDSAILVASLDQGGDLWVRQATTRKMSDEKMIGSMLDHYEAYGATALKCEAVSGFKLIEPVLRRMADDRGTRVMFEQYEPGTKRSKTARIRSLFPLFQSGRIRIPEDQYDLLSEVRRYCGRQKDKDNLLDTLSMAAEDLMVIPAKKEPLPIAEAVDKIRHEQDMVDWQDPDRSMESMDFVDVFGMYM